ncbi:fatty acyl-AMP ligase [Streptosporangiaceae bacterium NEAU-GS5]|nr:fatty acyl-AMP ligase [Streptosporangiaceae bacterium NEAU-GS5]
MTAVAAHAAGGNDTACTFVDYGTERAGIAQSLDYAELDERARRLAAALQARCVPGDRAAILCPQGLDYVVAFLACLYAGVIAVPLYPPDDHRSNERLLAVTADAAPAILLTSGDGRDAARRVMADDPRFALIQVLGVDEIDAVPPYRPVVIGPDDIAYLQYTSGSTRRPAGVEVTHGNIQAGAFQILRSIRLTPGEAIASWLPLFHDMGLVFTLITPLFAGAHLVFTSPYAFILRPSRWLRLISDHRAVATATPNFGLDLCVERVSQSQRVGLDLGSLRAVVNGSEPVRRQSLQRFTEAFAGNGFRAETHCPAYGLAEATLAVTAATVGEGASARDFDAVALGEGLVRLAHDSTTPARTLVSCGRPVDQQVRIADPRTLTETAPERVGEVWVRGANVCSGYWNQPERTHETFGATLDGQSGWLRTGDLGFVFEGDVYIAGRIKDLVLIAGRNHFPDDIEAIVADAHAAVRRGTVAAFSVEESDAERLVVVAEVDPGSAAGLDAEVLLRTVRSVLFPAHGVELHRLVLVRPGGVPKTSSGKIRRTECRERYLTGSLRPAS